ncbi:MAG: phosphoglycerate kinase [Parcubacteria group bacterium]|nr:phosphoglycerate kinase [Parcubacteria group bacterium]
MKFLREYTRKELDGKQVLLRVDYNVAFVERNGKKVISDDYRITSSFASIDYLLANNAKIIVLAHFGDPKGVDPILTLQPISERLKDRYADLEFAKTFEEVSQKSKENKHLILLENIRFFEGEKENSNEFATKLASLGSLYINDAFAVSHRPNASVVAITKHLPSIVGMQMEKELTNLDKILTNVTHPFVCIVGGAKIGTKVPLINNLLSRADTVLVGSGIACPLLRAQGYATGKTIYEAVEKKELTMLFESHKILLPQDVVLETDKGPTPIKISDLNTISNQEYVILDVGEETIKEYTKYIAGAGIIVWNGPLGLFENPDFKKGSEAIAHAIANSSAFKVVGGGETVSLVHGLGLADKFDFVSTGGGAMISYLSGEKLPGIEALK